MFELADIEHLPAAIRHRELRAIPQSDLDAARADEPGAGERVRRALFWTFTYHLRPELWDALAAAEPIHPGVLRLVHEIGADRGRLLEIGAGSGRLTVHLVGATSELVALDPSIPLLRLLRSRVPTARLAAGWAEALPIREGWAHATVACSSIAMDDSVIGELQRVTRGGGLMVVISPEAGRHDGWHTRQFDPDEVPLPARDPWIDRVFGAPKPPSEVVWSVR